MVYRMHWMICLPPGGTIEVDLEREVVDESGFFIYALSSKCGANNFANCTSQKSHFLPRTLCIRVAFPGFENTIVFCIPFLGS